MKKLLPFLALAILISSCGNKMTLLKRHYTKGYYMQHSKQSEKVAINKAKIVSTDKMEPTIVSFIKENKAAPPVLSASLKINKGEKTASKQSHSQELNKHIALQNNIVNSMKVASAKAFAKESANQQKENRGGGGDANLLILVILCLFPFINLIAMYLHDGKSVTTNFWLDLILDILFFLPGIIFALLVVFDVVNLA